MAQMYPPGVSRELFPDISDAEVRVYEAIQKQCPDDWHVLHSLWLKDHHRKDHAEVDFVVIGKRACLLLEVKGGMVSRDRNGWHFHTRRGHHRKTQREGPFDQARGTYYAIKTHLSDLGKLNLFHDFIWGYGVITPDCIPEITGQDTSFSSNWLLDLTGFPRNLDQFLDGLADYWQEKSLQTKRENGIREETLNLKIPPPSRFEILNHLRPAFECIQGTGVKALQAEAELLALTDGQYRALDFASENDRVVITGSAGTGKSLLAFEQARRQAVKSNGEKKILLTCFNRLLAEHLSRKVSQIPEMKCVEVKNYHQLVLSLVRQAGLGGQILEDWETFNANVEEITLEALARLPSFELYDYLVLDEAQDLMNAPFMSVIDMLLEGGTEHGCWTMCIDQDQTVFQDMFDRDLCERYLSNSARVTLSVNCRNTRQIAGYVTGLTGAGSSSPPGAAGPDVQIDYYSSFQGFIKSLKRTVNNLVRELDEVEIDSSDIAILSGSWSHLPEEVWKKGFFVRPVSRIGESDEIDGTVQMGTVQSFKGLEATAVVLIGLEGLESHYEKLLAYVGASRARTVLKILLPDSCSQVVQVRLESILAALASRE